MKPSSVPFLHAKTAVYRHDLQLLRDPNVVGVGVGTKCICGEDTEKICVVVMVAKKERRTHIAPDRLIPSTLPVGEGIEVETDVIETGHHHQLANTARIRPAKPGTSLGSVLITAGTFGGVVIDNKSQKPVILSNNHVLAANNQAAIGSDIVQPGPIDGGVSPGDKIATLTRFVKIVKEPTTNLVDAAIATPVNDGDIDNAPLNGVPKPGPDFPAVGLLWGGNSTRSNFSPMSSVLSELDVSMPAKDSVKAPSPGLKLQKTGRTTEKTTGTIQEVNVTLKVFIPEIGGTAIFRDQFTTTSMSQGGDSGSVAVTEQSQG